MDASNTLDSPMFVEWVSVSDMFDGINLLGE